MKFQQQPHTLLLIRPKGFAYNKETSSSNVFQHDLEKHNAVDEFDRMTSVLEAHEISVLVLDDTPLPHKPDAIFPNNWISCQPDGKVVLYPMMADNRRLERRSDIIDILKEKFAVSEIIDLSTEEVNGRYLEGTGSIVFDHVNRIAYACRSPRTNVDVLNALCDRLNYTAVVFDALDEGNKPIYHTNVVMSVGERFAVVCLDAVRNDTEQEKILESLMRTNHQVVAISYAQMSAFAGNIIEVKSNAGENIVLMSKRAFESFLPGQLNAITKHAEVLTVSIPSIETIGGGGVRCMVAGIHLPLRKM